MKVYRFDEKVLTWIEKWLQGRTSVVSVNGTKSSPFHVTSGVPQHSVLGPLPFLLYINDIPLCVRDSFHCLYADDTLLGMDVTECGRGTLQENITV